MTRRPPRYTRTDTLFPYTTLVRSCQLVPTQNRHARLFARIPIDLSPIRYKYDIIIISNDSEGKMVETGTPALNRSRETRANTQSGPLMLFIWLALLGLAAWAGISNANSELLVEWPSARVVGTGIVGLLILCVFFLINPTQAAQTQLSAAPHAP